MARAMGGAPAERTEQNRKDNECSARQAGGRSSRQVLGRPTVQWALDERGGTRSKYEKLAPLRFIKSKDHYGRSNPGPMEVGARPRSILDQTKQAIGAVALTSFFIDSI